MHGWRCSIKLCGKWCFVKRKDFENIWIQPAAGDAGGAGAALSIGIFIIKDRRLIN